MSQYCPVVAACCMLCCTIELTLSVYLLNRSNSSVLLLCLGFARCPQQHYILPGDRYMTGPAFKSSSGSSTSSDSDYIETLSLCSSGSNGSGSEYLRCEDMAGKACPVSCVLKPRSAKEYNAVDRTGVHQEPDEERGSALHVCHRAHHAPIHLTLPKSACSRPSPTKTTVTSKTSSPVASCHGSSTSSFPQQPEPYFQVPWSTVTAVYHRKRGLARLANISTNHPHFSVQCWHTCHELGLWFL